MSARSLFRRVCLIATLFTAGLLLGIVRTHATPQIVYATDCTNYTDEYDVYGWSNFNCPPYGCTWSVTKFYTWSRAVSDHTCPLASESRYMGVEAYPCSGTETLVLEAWNGTTLVGSWADSDGDGVVKSPCFSELNWPSTWRSYFLGSSVYNEICIDEHRWFSGCCDCY